MLSSLIFTIAACSSFALGATVVNETVAIVNLRVEGLNTTIFEAPVPSYGHNITLAGVNKHCDGTNYGINPTPGPTATAALDTASKLGHFTYDANDWAKYDDFFITRIGPDTNNTKQFWGILNNWNYTPVGGCQERVRTSDEVLFAFDAFSKKYFLKTTGPFVGKVGVPVVLQVTDGTTGIPIEGATIHGVQTSANGTASITFASNGVYSLKAERADSIRSNAHVVVVLP